jgi:hypothetical protein
VKLEKAVTDAFKNKQTEVFRKYLAPEFSAIDAEGVNQLDPGFFRSGLG